MNKRKQWNILGNSNLLQKVLSLNDISDENIKKYVRFSSYINLEKCIGTFKNSIFVYSTV